MASVRSDERLQIATADITRLLEKHRVLEALVHRQEGPRRDLLENPQHRQNLVELHRRLRLMHPADVGFVLEALPHEHRRTVWTQLTPEHAGQVLVEVADAVRESLVAMTPREDLMRALLTLDPEDLAFMADALDPEVRDAVSGALRSRDRLVFDQAARYGDASVGRYMTREWIAVADTHTIQRALADLRAVGELPPQTDRIFVVDARNVLRGTCRCPR